MTTAQRVILLPHGFQAEYECGFANGLARLGVAVTLLGSDATLVDRLEPTVEVVNCRGSRDPKRTRWAKAVNLMRYTASYLTYLARHRGQPVHMIGMYATPSSWMWLLEAWCTRWLAGRYILTVHNLLPHDDHSLRMAWVMRSIYRSAAVCMVHTEKMRGELHRRFGVPLGQIVVVQHGIDRLSLLPPESRPAMRRRFGIPPDAPVVLFFGIIARYKGLDLLLAAMDLVRQRRDAVLVVAGLCRETELKQWLHSEMAPRVASGTAICFEGYLPEDDMVPLFQAADLVAMPYRHIDQSGVVFMARATGLPVVATNVGSLADYIQAPGAVVPPGDAPALAAAILRVFDEPRPDSATLAGRAEPFLWSKTAAPMIGVYRGLWPRWSAGQLQPDARPPVTTHQTWQ